MSLSAELRALLVKGVSRPNGLKERLLAEGAFLEACAGCGIGPEWNGRPLTLHLDHINGDPTDNRLNNLRLLCPNCHNQTPTFGRGNWKQGEKPAGDASGPVRAARRAKALVLQWNTGDEGSVDALRSAVRELLHASTLLLDSGVGVAERLSAAAEVWSAADAAAELATSQPVGEEASFLLGHLAGAAKILRAAASTDSVSRELVLTEIRASDLTEAILRLIHEKGGAYAYEIASATGRDPGQLSRKLSRLTDKGLLVAAREGRKVRYQLSASAGEALGHVRDGTW